MRAFNITVGSAETQKAWPKANQITLGSFLSLFTNHLIVNEKKGTKVFLPGSLVGEDRKAKGVKQIDALVYDVDGTQSIDDIKEIVINTAKTAIVYTSFSHMSRKTYVTESRYNTFVAKNREYKDKPITKESLLKCLKFHNEHYQINNVYYDPHDPKCVIQTSNGIEQVLTHDPVSKMRVIFPLKTPIVLTELGNSSKQYLAEYKAIYHGVGKALGLIYDEACEDPSRIFFFPSCSKESYDAGYNDCFGYNIPLSYDEEGLKDWRPDLLDFNDYPRIVPREGTKLNEDGTRSNINTSEYIVIDREGARIDLMQWANKNPDFDIEELILNCLPDEMVLGTRDKGGYVVDCPYREENHSDPSVMGGTFAANGDGENPWVVFCSHQSCLKINNRNRLHYLMGYIKQGHVTAKDLGLNLSMSAEDVASVLNVDPSTLPSFDSKVFEDEETDNFTAEDDAANLQKAPSEDDGKSSREVYNECLALLGKAKTFIDAKIALDRMRVKGCELDTEEIQEKLAESSLTQPVLKRVFHILSLRIPYFDRETWFEFISNSRLSVVSLESAINSLFLAHKVGAMLSESLTKLAQHYCLPKETVLAAFNKMQGQIDEQRYDDNTKQAFEMFEKRYAKITIGGKLMYLDMEESEREGTPKMYPKGSLKDRYENMNFEVPSKRGPPTTVYVFDEFRKQRKNITEFSGVTFVPKGPRIVDNKFNVWSDAVQYGVTPKKGDCSRITDHIKKVWCRGDEKLFNWVMMWFADIVQFPERRPTTALLVVGSQGTGKSFVCEKFLQPVLGPGRYGSSAKRDDLLGKFNKALAGKTLWLAEEALFAGDRHGMQVLKSLITAPSILIEEKGNEKYEFPSFTRFIFTANSKHALHLEQGDRRFVVMETTDDVRRNTEYFQDLEKWAAKEGCAYFLQYLLDFKPEDYGLKWSDLKDAYETEFKEKQIEYSRECSEQFFTELLRYGRIVEVSASDLDNKNISWGLTDDKVSIHLPTVRQMFDNYLSKFMGTTMKYERSRFTSLFEQYMLAGKTLGDDNVKGYRRVSDKFTRVVNLPTREEALKYAVLKRMISLNDLEEARSNPTSHMDTPSEV
ncbi:MAG: primase-helicase family protein [Betaproteobacteria bacterium]